MMRMRRTSRERWRRVRIDCMAVKKDPFKRLGRRRSSDSSDSACEAEQEYSESSKAKWFNNVHYWA